jgi:hypothetical protein
MLTIKIQFLACTLLIGLFSNMQASGRTYFDVNLDFDICNYKIGDFIEGENCIRDSSEIKVLIRYDEFIKQCLFQWEDYQEKPSFSKLLKWKKRIPEAIAPNVILDEQTKKANKSRKSSIYMNTAKCIAQKILATGEGTFEKPFDTVSFYDAYYFMKFEYGVGPQKVDFVADQKGRLLGEFVVYLSSGDQMVTLYFDISHLASYYLLEIEKMNSQNENLFEE